MRLGLIRYTGRRTGPFPVEKLGQMRYWAHGKFDGESFVKERRWLPESEATEYAKLPGFTLMRWGQETRERIPGPRPRRREGIIKPTPAPQAMSVASLLAQEPEPEEEAPFLMSSTGMLHKRECGYAPKKPAGEFWLVDEAAADGRFSRFHKCVMGDE